MEFIFHDLIKGKPGWYVNSLGKLGQWKELGRIELEGLSFIFLKHADAYVTKDEREEIERKLAKLNHSPKK